MVRVFGMALRENHDGSGGERGHRRRPTAGVVVGREPYGALVRRSSIRVY